MRVYSSEQRHEGVRGMHRRNILKAPIWPRMSLVELRFCPMFSNPAKSGGGVRVGSVAKLPQKLTGVLNPQIQGQRVSLNCYIRC